MMTWPLALLGGEWTGGVGQSGGAERQPPKRSTRTLTPGTCECDYTWGKVYADVVNLKISR